MSVNEALVKEVTKQAIESTLTNLGHPIGMTHFLVEVLMRVLFDRSVRHIVRGYIEELDQAEEAQGVRSTHSAG